MLRAAVAAPDIDAPVRAELLTNLGTSPDLTDEAIHITTACQLAGYAHVIGTLWPIVDGVAAKIADRVYAVLGDGEQPAHALHTAIRATRAAYPATPLLWASHVHVGA